MRKYTQADFDSAPRDADGWMELPAGDWSAVNFGGAGRLVFGEGGNVFSAGSRFGECCAFGMDASFGASCVFGARCSFDINCQIGAGAHIGDGATFEGGIRIGDDSVIGARCQIGECCWIGANCQIGAHCEIADGYHIGAGSIIDVGCVVYAEDVLDDERETFPRIGSSWWRLDSAHRVPDGVELHPALAQELGTFEDCERVEILD